MLLARGRIPEAEHFSEKLPGDLYEVMGTMIAEGRPVNPITIKPYIPADQMIAELTMFAYVIRLASEAVTTSGSYDYGAGIWFWTCFEGGARGTVPSKDEAVGMRNDSVRHKLANHDQHNGIPRTRDGRCQGAHQSD